MLLAEYNHHLWTVDLQFDQTMDGRSLKFLNVIDEDNWFCLKIRNDRLLRTTPRKKTRSRSC